MGFGIIVYGRRPYGRVESFAGSCVLTTFSHVWFFPIVPRGSYVLSESESGAKEVPIGMHLKSILATYARVWGVVWFVACLVALGQGERGFVLGTSIWVDFSVLSSVLVWGYVLAGRISPRIAAQRRVYAKFAGVPVDVARYSRAQAHDLRQALEQILVDEGRGQSFGYRDERDPRQSWRELAMHDDVRNVNYLEAALTRARLEYQWASTRSDRRTLAEAHEHIWKKLAALPTG
jgi:hypothetical protein